ELGGLARRDRPPRDARGERLAVDELHRDEQLAAGVADFVELTDARMRDRGGGARFPAQPVALVRLGAAVQHLDGDLAPELFVARGEDDTHAAASELAENAVATDGGWDAHRSVSLTDDAAPR